MSPKTVVITGASAGVGRATAIAFAKEGANVALIARGKEGLESTRLEVESYGHKALIFIIDVSDSAQIELAANQIVQAWGSIDIWVNNAMVSVFSPFKEMTSEEFRKVTEVTYLGVVYGTKAALKHMLSRNSGIIVQVGSTLAYRGIPLQSAYCGAKHAIKGFTESLRCELMHDGSNIKITMVQLPALNTPQFTWTKSRMPFKPQPVSPIFQPEIAAKGIVWVTHHYRRELKIGFLTTLIIFLNSFFPGLGDLYLAKTGYKSQQTKEPDDHKRPFNLWEPVAKDLGTHGSFDKISNVRSLQLWIVMHGIWFKILSLIILGLLFIFFI